MIKRNLGQRFSRLTHMSLGATRRFQGREKANVIVLAGNELLCGFRLHILLEFIYSKYNITTATSWLNRSIAFRSTNSYLSLIMSP